MKKEKSTQIPSALISPEVVCSPAFGRCIRKIREERGLTMLEVSKETGIHYTAISSFERGVRGKVSAEKAMKIYDYLMEQPLARTPLPTGKHSIRKKHRRAKVEKQPVQTPEVPIEAPIPEEPKPEVEVPEVSTPEVEAPIPEEPKPEAEVPERDPKGMRAPVSPTYEQRRRDKSRKTVIRSVQHLIRETNIRALECCTALIEEIDHNDYLTQSVKTSKVLELIQLTNFIVDHKELWR